MWLIVYVIAVLCGSGVALAAKIKQQPKPENPKNETQIGL